MRYRADEACVTITPCGSRLLVRWASADHFGDILAGFRSALPRHGDACWNGEQGAWSVAPQARERLEQWLAWSFEPSCIQWRDEEPAPAGASQAWTRCAGHGAGACAIFYYLLLLHPDTRQWGGQDV